MQRSMLRSRLDRQYRRELAAGPTPTFGIGAPVMLLRPPADKMTHGAVGSYVVVTAEANGAYYSVALMGPDGGPSGLPTRAAAGQLRPFDMSRTTPEAEWRRLHEQEFGDDMCPTRAVTGHRRSRRASADARDLEFDVVWITADGDVVTQEPARHLSAAGNVHFKEYVREHGLTARVREQVRRERAVSHAGET